MDAVDSSGLVVPVSVWSYKLNDMSVSAGTPSCHTTTAGAAATDFHCRRRLLVLEPVNCVITHVVFDSCVSVCVILKQF